ncbi:hypothetical protein [Paenarthrobacter sp. NPDC089316]|uniref:hypothetical protein n=1 Tax=unclassified Paenarthrobacter TaxID=2634190 RepID=UPI003433A668
MKDPILIPLAGGKFGTDESLFPRDAKSRRFALLEEAGFSASALTGVQRLAVGSLGWGTASEGALRILSRALSNNSQLHAEKADAVIAACRVSRGLAEDRRTQNDPWVHDLIAAAERLAAGNEYFHPLLVKAKGYQAGCLSGDMSLERYLHGLAGHPYALVGAAIASSEGCREEAAAVVQEFTGSMGVLHGITERTAFSPNSRKKSTLVTPDFLSGGPEADYDADRQLLRETVARHARSVLRSVDLLSTQLPNSPAIEQVKERAFMTLRDTGALLRTLTVPAST